jgi:Predicted metal-dependent hydrolase of the TIM-barrel fold
MPTTDGWLNVFRLSAADPVQEPDEDLRSVHALFGGDGPDSWLTTTVDDALQVMDETGTERALLTVGEGRPHGRRTTVSLMGIAPGLRACRLAPERFRLVLQLQDVSSPHAAAQLVREHGVRDEVVAVGVMPSYVGCDLGDRKLYPSYDACVDLGLPVRINLGITGPALPSRHQHPELLEELLLDFPDLRIIGCHMGHPYEALLIRLMIKFPNLHLMTSGYSPKYFDPAIVRFMGSVRGAGRIMFGSDHPGVPLPKALAEARKLPIGEDALDQFLGSALCDVLGWT